jgi:penicillin-binding protein 2
MKFNENGFHSEGEGAGDIKRRLWLLSVCVLVFFAVIVLRLWYLQVIKGSYYRELSENNRIRIISIRPPRGIIYDRNGIPLAENTPSYTITFTPEDAKGMPQVATKLASIIGETPDELETFIRSEKYRNPYQPIRVRENASFAEISKVEAAKDDLPGVSVEVELRRYYPYGDFASHLIGYIGKITPEQHEMPEYADLPPDFLIGQYGIEKLFDKDIRGVPGKKGVEVDAMGRQKRIIYTVEPVAGEDLVTTIDYKAQAAAEEAMKGHSGAIVAIDPQNGDVLAMVSKPGFDPNIFPVGLTRKDWQYLTTDKDKPLNNRALQGQFPPGSTFKLAMSLAGLETGKATLDSPTVTCTGGWGFGGRVFHCWDKHGHGRIQLHMAIVESCDVYFYNLGNNMGIDNIAKYANYLGLGMPTGIGLREGKGLIPSTAWKEKYRHCKWYAGETISCSIGQGYVSVTPIQLARMTATLTNGGTLYQPQVVSEIRYRDGQVKQFPKVALWKIPAKQQDLDIIEDGMKGVVWDPRGTAHAAQSDRVVIGGKTGTAQVIGLGKGRGMDYKDHAWFVGAAPMDNPKIAICVLVEHGGHGGSVSAPMAKQVIEAYLRIDDKTIAQKNGFGNLTGVFLKKAVKNFSNITGSRLAAFRTMTGAAKTRTLLDSGKKDQSKTKEKAANVKSIAKPEKKDKKNPPSKADAKPHAKPREALPEKKAKLKKGA